MNLQEAVDWFEGTLQPPLDDTKLGAVAAAARSVVEGTDPNRLLDELSQRFNPPDNLSLDEKTAWKDGVYYAIDFLRPRILSRLLVEKPE